MKLNGGERCVYCGYYADVRDHVIPWSFNNVRGKSRTYEEDNVVPACSECNLIAGDKVFEDLTAKRDHIQGRIAQKYRKLLAMPDWTDEEVNKLASKLRKYVKMQMNAKRFISARLRWPFNYYSLVNFSDDVFRDLFEKTD